MARNNTEKVLEDYIEKRVNNLKGFTRKVLYQGRAGSPDRWCFLPGGVIVIFECKTDVGKISEIQKIEVEKLNTMGFSAYIVRTFEEVDLAFNKVAK